MRRTGRVSRQGRRLALRDTRHLQCDLSVRYIDRQLQAPPGSPGAGFGPGRRRTAPTTGGRMAARSDVLESRGPRAAARAPMHGYELRKRVNARARLRSGRCPTARSTRPCRRCSTAGLIAEAPRPPATAPATQPARPDRLQADRRRQGAVRRPGRPTPGRAPGRTTNFGVRFAFFGRTDAEDAAAHPRGPAEPARGAARRRPAAARPAAPRADGPLHPGAAAPRRGVRRARGPLAHRADRHRAPGRAPPRQPPRRPTTAGNRRTETSGTRNDEHQK